MTERRHYGNMDRNEQLFRSVKEQPIGAGAVSAHYSEGGSGDLPETPPELDNSRKSQSIRSDLLRQILSGGTDKDKLLIGALMLALLREGGDMRLIIALGYILL